MSLSYLWQSNGGRNAKSDIRTEVHFRESTITKSYQYIDTTDKNVVHKSFICLQIWTLAVHLS